MSTIIWIIGEAIGLVASQLSHDQEHTRKKLMLVVVRDLTTIVYSEAEHKATHYIGS